MKAELFTKILDKSLKRASRKMGVSTEFPHSLAWGYMLPSQNVLGYELFDFSGKSPITATMKFSQGEMHITQEEQGLTLTTKSKNMMQDLIEEQKIQLQREKKGSPLSISSITLNGNRQNAEKVGGYAVLGLVQLRDASLHPWQRPFARRFFRR